VIITFGCTIVRLSVPYSHRVHLQRELRLILSSSGLGYAEIQRCVRGFALLGLRQHQRCASGTHVLYGDDGRNQTSRRHVLNERLDVGGHTFFAIDVDRAWPLKLAKITVRIVDLGQIFAHLRAEQLELDYRRVQVKRLKRLQDYRVRALVIAHRLQSLAETSISSVVARRRCCLPRSPPRAINVDDDGRVRYAVPIERYAMLMIVVSQMFLVDVEKFALVGASAALVRIIVPV